MNRKKLIELLEKTNKENVTIQLCSNEGDVEYFDFKFFESDEDVLLEVPELKDFNS